MRTSEIITDEIFTESLDENLRKWFSDKWVRFGPDGEIRGECARGKKGEGKPKCLPQSKAHSLGKEGRASAARRKRREDPNPERKGEAKNVATKKRSDEEVSKQQLDELKCWSGYTRVKGVPAGAPGSCKKRSDEKLSLGGDDTKYKETYIIYVNGKPASKYDTKEGAVVDFNIVKKSHPDDDIVIKKRVSREIENIAERKKEVEEKWSEKYKSSIDCSHPKGFSQRAHCDSKKKNESVGESCPHCGGPMFEETMMNEKKDACYYKVKSRYKVWPSAYASGSLVKCRKAGAKNWGKSK